MKTTVQDLLGRKPSEIWSISPEATVYQAIELLASKDTGAVLVCEGEKLVGVFSERDYARKIILVGKSSKETLVKEVMSAKVVSVTPQQTLEDCMALMTEKHIRHLPVLVGQELIGIISIGDAVKAVVRDKDFLIQQLENYISS